jgi:hypothetical protein
MPKTERLAKQMVPGSFGAMVYANRRKHGITLEQAGHDAGFRDGTYLSLIEVSQRKPLLDRVPRIARAVKMSPQTLIRKWISDFAPEVYRDLYGDPDEQVPTAKAEAQTPTQ